ncbi:regulatory protein RecX [Oxobacter pfennigii]|uniref:Regulatory protein RecX n=1 Tax=Oxobacter pfennigii TaxID=36849 RepID=A0A0P8W5G4_9CLOT|nr:RecX family transcriptional regulator [Oxobacter pfennigii]KPU43887.1 regulatory protein RecX [Oxobacter pfennigii]
MVITSVTKQKKAGRFNIFVDDEYMFSAGADDILEYGIKEKAAFNERDLKAIIHQCKYKQAFNKAIKMLSLRCKSEYEIRKKLLSEFDNEVIDRVIERLKELRYIDDLEYTKQYIKDKISLNMLGKNRVKNDLRKKGIDINIINGVLAVTQGDDIEIAVKVIEKKLRVTKEQINDIKTRQKIYRFLIYRGFEYEVASVAINRYIEHQDFCDDV